MMGAAVEQRLSLDTDQTASLNQITDFLKASSADFQAICADVDVNAAAPDKLAQIEAVMTPGLEVAVYFISRKNGVRNCDKFQINPLRTYSGLI